MVSNNMSKNYKEYLYITLDMDWATDTELHYLLELITAYQVKITLFVTHFTPLLKLLENTGLVELGIHPNFNKNLQGSGDSTPRQIVTELLNIVPTATSVRSHSLTQQSGLLFLFAEMGITHDVNLFIPYQSGSIVYPFRFYDNRLVRIPYIWEDGGHCLDIDAEKETSWNCNDIFKYRGLKVVNFHPAHLYLNTETYSRYEIAKTVCSSEKECHINTTRFGVKDYFVSLINGAKSQQYETQFIKEYQHAS